MILVFDLEGPLSPMDHAAEAMRRIGKKIGQPDFFELFQMLSLYDDELTIDQKPGYNPGDTLRLIAPIVATNMSNEELVAISEKATLTPGARDLMKSLDMEDVYVASTSYQQHAYTIARRLGIPKEHVNCTELLKYEDFPYLDSLLWVFEHYKQGGIMAVKEELDALFWGEMEHQYLATRVCGGERKWHLVEDISGEKGVDISEFMVVGDSITDISMLEGVRKASGIAVSFNGNQYSVPKANLAVSALSLMALRPVLDAYPSVWEFVKDWNTMPDKMKLLKPDMREYFRAHKVNPFYDEVRNYTIDQTIARQKEMRAAMRKEYASLT